MQSAPSGRWGPTPVAPRTANPTDARARAAASAASLIATARPAGRPQTAPVTKRGPGVTPNLTPRPEVPQTRGATGVWGPTPVVRKPTAAERKAAVAAENDVVEVFVPRGQRDSEAAAPVRHVRLGGGAGTSAHGTESSPPVSANTYASDAPVSGSGVFESWRDMDPTSSGSAALPADFRAPPITYRKATVPLRERHKPVFNRATRERVERPLFDLAATKVELLNVVSCSLIREPRFYLATDPTRRQIRALADAVAAVDPEFILKLALYSRQDLNIRTTSNFLLALASNQPGCRAFLRKYFSAAVNLPSDFLDVVATYKTLDARTTPGSALPSALRRALVDKFKQFDAYQLGKYKTKGKRKKKDLASKKPAAKAPAGKKAAAKAPAKQRPKPAESGSDSDGSGSGSGEEDVADDDDAGAGVAAERRPQRTSNKSDKPGVTLKHLIRLLHIAEPVEHVMCILGKRYPANNEEFLESGLPGNFDSTRAGKRMKLPTPETWETQVSALGNKASTWERLIDHKKLPFMAMLRNLRNMIVTGVADKYHKWAMDRLSDEYSVVNSRQFPFAFFSAYDAIGVALQNVERNMQIHRANEQLKNQPAAKKGAKPKRPKKTIVPANMPTPELIRKYRAALDTAVKIATTYNCKPIRGNTVVFCDVSVTELEGGAAGKLSTAVRTVREQGILLGLMCKYVSEDCDFRVYASAGASGITHVGVELHEGTILDNMRLVNEVASAQLGTGTAFPFDYLESLIREKRVIDNLVILSKEMIAPGHAEMANYSETGTIGISAFLHKYRQEVNRDLLFVSVDLSGKQSGVLNEAGAGIERHPNDVLITGFSSSILSFIAERGDNNQAQYVEMIDEVKNLVGATRGAAAAASGKQKAVEAPLNLAAAKAEQKKPVNPEDEPMPDVAPVVRPEATVPHTRKPGEWAHARVFISSTFLDMHGERDVLTRYVFPELRDRCAKLRVRVTEVDLRWGISEEEAKAKNLLEVCLNEVDRCRPFFVGLLGDRYGYVPDEYHLPEEPRFDVVREYPKGRSITELEMYYGVLANPSASRAFFYMRDRAFGQQVPREHQTSFIDQNRDSTAKLAQLRDRIRTECTAFEYPARWGGVVDGKPVAAGLEVLADRILEDLWDSIAAAYPIDTSSAEDPLAAERTEQEAFTDQHARCFVGRRQSLLALKHFAEGGEAGPLVIAAKPGEGKSALLAKFTREYYMEVESKAEAANISGAHTVPFVLSHFIGAGQGSSDIRRLLVRVCRELVKRYSLTDEVPEDFLGVKQKFAQILKNAAHCGRIILVLDALNELDSSNHAQHLDWLPQTLPASVRLVVSVQEGTDPYTALKHRATPIIEMTLPPLDFEERRELIRTTLWQYRKRLDEKPFNNQIKLLTGKKDSPLPLFLIVACEELRVFGVYDKLTDKLRNMGSVVGRLLEEVLARLENEHGKDLVKHALSLLAVARHGLLESEMLVLLKRPNEDQLPRAIWSQLFHGIETFLRPHAGGGEPTLEFFHAQFTAAVHARYLRSGSGETNSHKALADFFRARGDPAKDGSWRGDSARAFSELPFHLLKARAWKEVEEVLCSLAFIESKCTHGFTHELVGDYASAMAVVPHGSQKLDDFYRYVTSNAHVLSVTPGLAFQQAINQPASSIVAVTAQTAWDKGAEDRDYIQWLSKPTDHDALRMTLAGNAEPVTAVAVSPDGLMLACASRDCSLKIYDKASGSEMATLLGHRNWVTACTWSPDSRRLCSASYDETLKVWDMQTKTEVQELKGHRRRVADCAWSPDGRKIVSASWDCTLKLWNADTGKLIYTLSGHLAPVNACAFSADSFFVVSGSWDNTVKIWNARRGQVEVTLEGHEASIRAVAYSPDMKQVASVSVDGTLKLWTGAQPSDFKEVGSFQGHSAAINSVSFSADGSKLVSGSADQTVKIWSGKLGKEVVTQQVLDPKDGAVTCVAVSSDGLRYAAAGSDCVGRVFGADGVSPDPQLVLRGHTATVTSIVFSADDTELYTGSGDGTIRMWRADDGALIQTLQGHAANINRMAVMGRALASASDDLTVIVWDLQKRAQFKTLKQHTNFVNSVCFSPDGRSVASVGRDTNILVWDVKNEKVTTSIPGGREWLNDVAWSVNQTLAVASWDFNVTVYNLAGSVVCKCVGHISAINSVAWSADGKLLASASADGQLKVWSDSGNELTTIAAHAVRINKVAFHGASTLVTCSDDATVKSWNPLELAELRSLMGHSDAVRGVTFAPGGDSIVSTSDDATVKVWETTSATAQEADPRHSAPVTSLAFTPTADTLVSSSEDMTVRTWLVNEGGRAARTLTGHVKPVTSVAATADTAVTSSHGGELWLWDLATGRQTRKLEGVHSNSVMAVAYSPNGKTLASGAWDCTVKLTELKSGQATALVGHTDWVTSVAWSPDGKQVASGSYDGSVRVWNAQGGKLVVACAGHTNWVRSVAFSPDGRRVVSASHDGSVRTWDPKTGNQLSTVDAGRERVNAVAYSADGRFIVSGAHDSKVRVFEALPRDPAGQSHYQVGEFLLKGPCTAVATTGRGAASPYMGAGDSLGNVYLLSMVMGHKAMAL